MRSEENNALRVQQVRRTGPRPEGAMHRAVDIVDSDGKFEAVMASQPAGVPQFVLGKVRLPQVCAWMSLAHVDGDEVDSVPVLSVQFDHLRPGTLSDWAGQRSEEEDKRPATLCHGSIAEGAAVRCHEVEVRNPVARAGVSGGMEAPSPSSFAARLSPI